MGGVSLGENSKLSASLKNRERIRQFYGNILGCEMILKDGVDLVRLGDNFHIGIRYEESFPTEEEMLKAIWLELRVDDPEGLKAKILAFGIKQIDFRDKAHFYFQAPGGQVFRLVGKDEDMSSSKS